jgi:mevalonate pyrophosphate decarboxylase
MTEQDFIPKTTPKPLESGKVTWSAPSNIALVKYWGKKKHQIPENPSNLKPSFICFKSSYFKFLSNSI